MPSHRHRRRERGFDAALRLAGVAARRAGLPRPTALLRRLDPEAPRARRRTAAAFGLRAAAARRVAGRTVLLVDDVLTTGVTVRKCHDLLAAAGAREIRIAVLARTPRRERTTL